MSKLSILGRTIFVVGGAVLGKEKECLDSIEICQDLNKFQLLSQRLNQARRSPSLVPIVDGFLIVGGFNEADHLKSVERLCTKTMSITQIDNTVPTGFSCAASCLMKDGSTYIFGGYNDQGCLNTVTKIDNKSISSQKALITPLKNSSAIPRSDTEVLLFGGWDDKRTLDTVFLYNTTDGSQSLCSRLPFPIEGHGSIRHNDHIYITGGYDGICVVNKILRYDMISKETQILEVCLDIPRENHATVIIKEDGRDYILIIGGWDGTKSLKNCEKFLILQHEPWLQRVECILELNVPRNRPAAIVI